MRSISLLVRSCKNEFVTIPAPIDVILSDKEVRQPDLIMIHKDKLHLITNKGVEGSPDLVIEILSPTSIKCDRKDKMETYAAYAIREYWLIDPKQKALEQYVHEESQYDLREVYLEDHPIESNYINVCRFQ